MLFTESGVKSLPLCCIFGFILVRTQQDIPVISCVCQMLSLILCLVSLFQKFGSNQSKPEFTVDLRGGTVEWASKDKSSKKHVIEVRTHWTCSQLSALVFSFLVQTCQNKLSCFTFLSFYSSSWRPVREQSSWYSLRSTVSSVTGTVPLQRPSTHMWVEDTEALPLI